MANSRTTPHVPGTIDGYRPSSPWGATLFGSIAVGTVLSVVLPVVLTLAVGALGWWVAARLGLSAPAMLGSMIAVGLTNVLFDYAQMPPEVRVFAQSISGSFIAMSVKHRDIKNIRRLIVPVTILFSMLTVNTLLMGTVLYLFCGVDIYTALFSCVAGGVTDISMIAMDFHADASEVALMQTSRLVAVLLFFPAWIRFLCRDEPGVDVQELDDEPREPSALARALGTGWRRTAFTICVALGCGVVGKLSGCPAGTMVFALFGVAALNLSLGCCHMPMGTKRCAQLLAGSLVGSAMSSDTFSSLTTSLVPVALLFASYWLLNFVFTQICRHWRLMDTKSAMFASAPGGASDMALIAADLDADLAKIAAVQVMRAVYAVAVMPTVVLLFGRLFL